MEECQDIRGAVGKAVEQRLVDERQCKLGFHGLAELVGDGDIDGGVFARGVGFFARRDGDLQFAPDVEAFGCTAQNAAVDQCDADPEVGEVRVLDRDLELVFAFFNRDDLMVNDFLALVGEQGETFGHARVQAQRDFRTDLVRALLGEESQFLQVLVIGDSDRCLAGDGLVESVLAAGAQRVDAAFLEVQDGRALAGFRIGGDFDFLDRDLRGRLGVVADPRHGFEHGVLFLHLAAQDGDGEILADGLAIGADRCDLDFESLVGERQRLVGFEGDMVTEFGKVDGVVGGDVKRWDAGAEPQRRARNETRRVEADLDLAFGVRLLAELAAVGQADLNELVGGRRSPVIDGAECGLDFFAAEVNLLREIEGETDAVELELLDREVPLVRDLLFVFGVGDDAVVAECGGAWKLDRGVEGAEF